MTEPKIKPAGKGEIDQYAHLVLQKQELDKLLKELRPAIAALGEGSYAGNVHEVHITEVTTSSLSVEIAKSLLTPAEIAKATITSTSQRITVER